MKNSGKLVSFLVPIISILLAFVIGCIIMAVLGANPFVALESLWIGAFGSLRKVGTTLARSTPLIFTSLCACFAYRCGVFNLGGEGQFLMGSIVCCYIATQSGIEGLPAILLCLVGGAVAGGLWSLISGLLKVYRGQNEMIITIMLNYVALYLVEYLVNNPFKSEGMVVRTEEIQDSARLVSLVAHTRLNTGIFIALLAVFLFWVLFYKTKLGYEMRATGDSPFAAESAGINNKKNLLAAMFISGALAGIGGACEVMGVQGYYISGMTTGYGFSGIAIAVMGHNQPLGTLASALLFGALNAGASSMNRMTDIPGEFISVLQALIILFISTPGIVIAIQNLYKRRKAVTS